MSDLLRIAVTGLNAQQTALTTTGHNIANAGTAGYSRQRVEFTEMPAQNFGSGFIGNGVQVETIRRIADEFVIRQERVDTWVHAANDKFNFYSEQVDSILNDANIGMSARINAFFDSLQAAADDPQSIPTRQVVISEAEVLAERFNSLHDRLSQINGGLNIQINSLAEDATSLAQSIAELNSQILASKGISLNDPPNDLLDQRDQQLRELAEIIDIQTVRDGNSINVFVGKGQALVIDGKANELLALPDRFDAARQQVAVVITGSPRVISDNTTGGAIGGIMQFRDTVLDQSFAALGRVAIAIGENTNAQHALGLDLDGDFGGLLFNDANAPSSTQFRAQAANDNDAASTGTVGVLIDDVNLLTTSSYQLDIRAGGSWQLYRNSDDTVVASGAALATPLVTVDGFTLLLNLPAGNFVAGDSFLIEPTRRGADFISAEIDRAEDLAFAEAVRAESAAGNIGNGVALGTITFDTTDAIFATPGQLSPPLQVRFTSTTQFDVLNAITGVAIVSGLSFTPGVTNTLFSSNPVDPDYFGFQFSLTGNPAAGDAFNIDYNANGVSDNRNALALAKLQTADKLIQGSATYQSAYGGLVSFVGVETRQSRIDTEASQSLLAQTQQTRESISGVNLDEEAANLIRFEQAYNASAQLITVARSIIDSLFDALRS